MTRHLPLLPCLLGLALYIWRPEWVSVAVLALLLCFALYLDNRERRADDIEEVQESVEALRDRLMATAGLAEQVEAIKETQAVDRILQVGMEGEIKKVAAIEFDMKKLRADMEAIRVALQSRPGRPPL